MSHKEENPLSICEKWELFDTKKNLEHVPVSFWRALGNETISHYRNFNKFKIGSGLLNLKELEDIITGRVPLSKLGIYIMLFDTVWLPDPFYSYLTKEAKTAWSYLPESGSDYMGKAGVHIKWEQVWDAIPKDRKAIALRVFKPVIQNLRLLKPLIEMGVIKFFPWEKIISSDPVALKESVLEASKDSGLQKVSTSFNQDEYSLGVRLGPMGISMPRGDPSTGVKPGERLFFVDKRPMVTTALVHFLTSVKLGASHIPHLSGDYAIMEYLLENKYQSSKSMPLTKSLDLPNINKATWEDIVAIREDSEVLTAIRGVLKEAYYADEEKIKNELKESLNEISSKIRDEKSLMRAVGQQLGSFNASVLGGIGTGAITGGGKEMIVGAVVGGAVPLVYNLIKSTLGEDATKLKTRQDLLIKLDDSLK